MVAVLCLHCQTGEPELYQLGRHSVNAALIGRGMPLQMNTSLHDA